MPKGSRSHLRVPDHEVLRKIGGGAYGEVWLARAVTGAMRAVKVVWREDFDDERTFEREFEGILRFEPISRNHPGLMNILHVGRSASVGESADSFYYCVMELGDDVERGREVNPVDYEPRTLRTDMKAAGGKPLEVGFCIGTGRLLAEALAHLHEEGLAHRDVKPSNVIFVDGRAKLADIGLVAARDQRTFVGTEGFVPPEGPGSAQADVYSLGKVLYEMATGKDRLDFPELPEEGVPVRNRKGWIALNRIICDICEPHVSKRKISTAAELAEGLARLEAGKRRARRMNVGALVAGVVLLAGLFIGWNWWAWREWGTTEVVSKMVPVEPVFATVKVISVPEGVEVHDAAGDYLGVTPMTLSGVRAGTVLELRVEMPRFRDKTVRAEIPRTAGGPVMVEVRMENYEPPLEYEVWVDMTGMDYLPSGLGHLSAEMVGEQRWEAYRVAEKIKRKPRVVRASEAGQDRKVVAVEPEEAAGYAAWLTRQCIAEGRLPGKGEDREMMEIRPVMSREFPKNLLPEDLRGKDVRPFRLEVRTIPYAVLTVITEPPGVRLSVDGEEVGVTPWTGEVAPGLVSYTLEKEGYKSRDGSFALGDRESKELEIEMKKSEGVVFGVAWKNSLGMEFVPMGPDLMVSAWETRVRDYEVFAKETGLKHPAPGFPQTGDHPVVNANREDAEAFASWLTERERKNARIQGYHRYRLPTDAEWSRMAGLREFKATPAKRDLDEQTNDIYPWGTVWPPPAGSGNYADLQAAKQPGIAADRTISGYDDGFAFTSPVGSFRANQLDIFDLGGNVQEWVSDPWDTGSEFAVARGGGWNSFQKPNLFSRHRNARRSDRGNLYGFRVVLAKTEEGDMNDPVEPSQDVGD